MKAGRAAWVCCEAGATAAQPLLFAPRVGLNPHKAVFVDGESPLPTAKLIHGDRKEWATRHSQWKVLPHDDASSTGLSALFQLCWGLSTLGLYGPLRNWGHQWIHPPAGTVLHLQLAYYNTNVEIYSECILSSVLPGDLVVAQQGVRRIAKSLCLKPRSKQRFDQGTLGVSTHRVWPDSSEMMTLHYCEVSRQR